MNVIPPPLAALIEDLSRLPGIGAKTASRLALHLLRRPPSEARALAHDLAELHTSICLCSECCAFSESDPCPLCADTRRDPNLICVVEGPDDLIAIEKTGVFHGRYHILHGVLSPMEGIGPAEIKIDELFRRIRRSHVKEVLIATSSTVPGEATAAYLMEQLHKEHVKVSRFAYGIPMGMDIKYLDEVTLAKAISARKIEGKDESGDA